MSGEFTGSSVRSSSDACVRARGQRQSNVSVGEYSGEIVLLFLFLLLSLLLSSLDITRQSGPNDGCTWQRDTQMEASGSSFFSPAVLKRECETWRESCK